MKQLADIASNDNLILNDIIPQRMTPEDEVLYIWSDECHICGGKFEENEKQVRDHSHLNGEYRDAAHNACNLEFQ